VTWFWNFETAAGEPVGQSESFESRSDAETWIGENFGELLEKGVDRVVLFDGVTEVYGPMSLNA
jgi:hypothetical protein